MKRRDSRELALKLLYSVELSDLDQIDATQRYASFQKGLDPEVYEYAVKLLNWTLASYKEIQEQLKPLIKNWSMERLGKIDKALIYMACAEIGWGKQPEAVVINEVLELAKKYGDKDSAGFINGVVDAWVKMR